MTENLRPGAADVPPPEVFDARDPDNIAPLVVWLGSSESREVTGCVFDVHGGSVDIAEGWRRGENIDKGDRWDPEELGKVVGELMAKRPPQPERRRPAPSGQA
jgi:hypothetical protein